VVVGVLALRAPAKAAGNKVEVTQAEYELIERYKHLDEIRQLIEQRFYQEVDDQLVMEGGIAGLFDSLDDPYSFYYSLEDMASMEESITGNYKGIGIQILANPDDDSLTIVRVFKGSPAEAAGIRAGDRIVMVNEIPVAAKDMNEAVSMMRGGTVGTTVDVTVRRGEELIPLTVARGDIQMNNVESEMLENNIGYIRLYSFEGEADSEYEDALDALKADGMASLILDLRDNPGGITDICLAIAETIFEDELVYYTQDRYGIEVNYYADGEALGVPLVVLCNGNSASASEILIGAVQSHGAGTIIGEKTFGKGIVQSMYQFPEGDGMQVTTHQYFIPNGQCIHGVGIEPDIRITLAEDAYDDAYNLIREKDNQLQAAIDVLSGVDVQSEPNLEDAGDAEAA